MTFKELAKLQAEQLSKQQPTTLEKAKRQALWLREMSKSAVKKKEVINISGVEYLGDYCLSLKFEDGTVKDVDLSSFIREYSKKNRFVAQLRDKVEFSKFRIDDGNLMWGEMVDIACWELYYGEVGKKMRKVRGKRQNK